MLGGEVIDDDCTARILHVVLAEPATRQEMNPQGLQVFCPNNIDLSDRLILRVGRSRSACTDKSAVIFSTERQSIDGSNICHAWNGPSRFHKSPVDFTSLFGSSVSLRLG